MLRGDLVQEEVVLRVRQPDEGDAVSQPLPHHLLRRSVHDDGLLPEDNPDTDLAGGETSVVLLTPPLRPY